MTLEIVFVGLCAIVTSEEIACDRATIPIAHPTDPLNVVMLTGSLPHPHEPVLWIRVDGLATVPGTCWTDRANDTNTTQCGTQKDKKWARFPLAGHELAIIQETSATAKIRKGYRKLEAGKCWAGARPGNQNNACKGLKDQCEKDVSWLPEYIKATGVGEVSPDVLTKPHNFPWVASIIRGLRGTLESVPESTAHPRGQEWEWEWNFPECEKTRKAELMDRLVGLPRTAETAAILEALLADPPEYKQQFAGHAIVGNIGTSSDSIWLVPIFDGSKTEQEIKLTGSPKMEIWNLPRKDADPPPWMAISPIQHDDKCYIPHFDAYSQVLRNPPTCRRVPYFKVNVGASCTGAAGPNDPFCMPAVFP